MALTIFVMAGSMHRKVTFSGLSADLRAGDAGMPAFPFFPLMP
jgi:hypothetical protein